MAEQPKPITLTSPPENTEEECDRALGAYMRTWDQVEMELLPFFTKLFGTHQNAMLVLVHSGLNQNTIREVLESLSVSRLREDDQKALSALLRRWKNASTKRNHIVHGRWQIHIKMIPGPSGKRDHTKSHFERFYAPSDPSIYHKMFTGKDAKLIAAHVFTLKDMEQASKDVLRLAKDLTAFRARIRVLDFVTPQPIELEQ